MYDIDEKTLPLYIQTVPVLLPSHDSRPER